VPDKQYELASRAEWGDDLGEVLSVDEAAQLMADVLGVGHDYSYVSNVWPGGKPIGSIPVGAKREEIWRLIRNAVATIPEELRTEVVINGMDMRTILDPIALDPDVSTTKVPVTVNGVEFSPGEQTRARSLFVDYADGVDEDLRAAAASREMEPSAEAEWLDQEGNKWRTDKTKLVPMTTERPTVVRDQQTGEVQTVGATPSDPLAFTIPEFDETGQTMAFMTGNDVRLMFRDMGAPSAFGQYMTNLELQEANAAQLGINDQRLRDPTSLDMEGILPTKAGYHPDTGSMAGIEAASNYRGQLDDSYTLTQAKSLPGLMTRAQVMALTEKMRKAGIFDQVAGGEPAIKGDPTDPQFKEAYTLLLGKAIELGRSPALILKDGALAYDEHLKDKVHTSVTDPARVRLQADAFARTELGRTLTRNEHAELVVFIHDLERKNNMADVEAEESGGETTEIDWTAQMEEFLTRQNQPEAAAKDVANSYNLFKGMLGPAGGSVG